MTDNPLLVRVDAPIGELPPGRGFYQVEEDSLYVQVGPADLSRKPFSYLENKLLRLDVDRIGRLMLIEVSLSERQWKVVDSVSPPRIAEPADIRWLGFRANLPEPQIKTNAARDHLLIEFNGSSSFNWYTVAESVFVQVDASNVVTAILVSGIVRDMAGQSIARFRQAIRES